MRLLKAVYHPRNQYLLHLDAISSDEERTKLAHSVRSVKVFRVFGNVNVIGKADASDRMGSSSLAAALHAAAVLLKINGDWDWFVTLSSSDYPIVTQDDLLDVFSHVPRNLNFIDHTSDVGWKLYQRVQPIVVDPGIYLARRTRIFYASQTRPAPNSFKFFTGSPWVILSRSFMEYCVTGYDNLPRRVLMYFTNVLLPLEAYFHTVLCNSPQFQNTTVNTDLRFLVWDTPPKSDPNFLNLTHFEDMTNSGAAFARRFQEDDPILNKIDSEILKRPRNGVVPGKWCSEDRVDVNIVEPGPFAVKLSKLISKMVAKENIRSTQCKF
ncbi:hypothetical protein AMTR_s00025p00147820 [Amborella trichopoda]|uniref:Uncharacterized protein n=2 Tax=Amborella trichopoda TaxID=13333 RepID=W1PX81_AMBTC|nr:hypothetical protein AMTR_s00025p00147820 [Amborella trichopoda]